MSLFNCTTLGCFSVAEHFPLLSVSIHMIHDDSLLAAGSGYYGPKVYLVFTEQQVSGGSWVKTLFCLTVCYSNI